MSRIYIEGGRWWWWRYKFICPLGYFPLYRENTRKHEHEKTRTSKPQTPALCQNSSSTLL